MLTQSPNHALSIPKGWPRRVRSAVIHTIALAQTSLTHARSVTANSASVRIRLKEENDRLRQEIQRFGAVGKYGSIAIIERFMRTLKQEGMRRILVSFRRAAFHCDLALFVTWYNAVRPHSSLGARTPDEVYFGKRPACREPRFEPRTRWPRRSPCATPHALIRGQPGVALELVVAYKARRMHLPLVTLKRVA